MPLKCNTARILLVNQKPGEIFSNGALLELQDKYKINTTLSPYNLININHFPRDYRAVPKHPVYTCNIIN